MFLAVRGAIRRIYVAFRFSVTHFGQTFGRPKNIRFWFRPATFDYAEIF